jgi:hypothetical protein
MNWREFSDCGVLLVVDLQELGRRNSSLCNCVSKQILFLVITEINLSIEKNEKERWLMPLHILLFILLANEAAYKDSVFNAFRALVAILFCVEQLQAERSTYY